MRKSSSKNVLNYDFDGIVTDNKLEFCMVIYYKMKLTVKDQFVKES